MFIKPQSPALQKALASRTGATPAPGPTATLAPPMQPKSFMGNQMGGPGGFTANAGPSVGVTGNGGGFFSNMARDAGTTLGRSTVPGGLWVPDSGFEGQPSQGLATGFDMSGNPTYGGGGASMPTITGYDDPRLTQGRPPQGSVMGGLFGGQGQGGMDGLRGALMRARMDRGPGRFRRGMRGGRY